MFTNCGQYFQYFHQISVDAFKFLIAKVLRFAEQLQPILCFIGFLEGDLHFCNKIRCALRSLCFRNL